MWWVWWLFLQSKYFGESLNKSFPTCIFLFCLFLVVGGFFFWFFLGGVKVVICLHAPILLFSQDQSTVAQWAEMAVDEHSLVSCMWAHFPDRVPTLCLKGIVSPLRLHWVRSRVYYISNVACHFHFWQNYRALLPAAVVTCEWNAHWIPGSTKVNCAQENSTAFPVGYSAGELLIMSQLWPKNIDRPMAEANKTWKITVSSRISCGYRSCLSRVPW